jgi:hypothetical protein
VASFDVVYDKISDGPSNPEADDKGDNPGDTGYSGHVD